MGAGTFGEILGFFGGFSGLFLCVFRRNLLQAPCNGLEALWKKLQGAKDKDKEKEQEKDKYYIIYIIIYYIYNNRFFGENLGFCGDF